MKRRMIATMLLLSVVVASPGCGGSDGTFKRKVTPPAADVSDKETWSIEGRGVQDPGWAIDGDIGTRARSTEGYRTASLTIDLGKACLFNMVAIEHGDDPIGYADMLTISTSLDGRAYTRRTVAPGNRKRSIVALVTPTLAQYVRIEVERPSYRPWSVAEIQLK